MKSIFKSKTVWFNLLSFAATAITFVTEHELFVENPDVTAALVGVMALINIGLRLVTDEPVAVVPEKESEE